jgi:hypothetical protein
MLIAALLACTTMTSACTATKEEPAVSTQTGTSAHDTQQPQADSSAKAPAEQQFIEMEGYRFKLDPDVQSDGVAHLDFYVRDKQDKHVKGVTGTFKISKPDGTKAELPIEEESPHDHYHGMLKLEQPGEYLIVTQVVVDGKKLNPRFSFTRK